jgi:hypothetical protein
MKRKLLIALKVLIVAAIVTFLAVAIYENIDKLRATKFSFSLAPFVLSTLLLIVCFIMQAVGWRQVLAGVAKPIPVREAAAIWFASQVAKYVPGKVMLPLVRFGWCQRRGIDVGRTTMSIYVELALAMGAVFAVVVISSVGWADAATWASLAQTLKWPGDPALLHWVLLAFVPFCLVMVHPRLLQWGINLGLRILRKEPVTIELSYGRIVRLFGWYLLNWLIYSVSCWLFMRSLGEVELSLAPVVAGAFMLSYLIGFLSFLTPGGVGVREAVMFTMLTWKFPPAIAIVAPLVARLQWTGTELLLAAVTLRDRPKPADEKAP